MSNLVRADMGRDAVKAAFAPDSVEDSRERATDLVANVGHWLVEHEGLSKEDALDALRRGINHFDEESPK